MQKRVSILFALALVACQPFAINSFSSISLARESTLNHVAVFERDTFLEMSRQDDARIGLGESDQGVLGAIGTVAALITFYSEYTLKTTGCGLPAGPLGLVGLAEGLSYLGVTGIGAFSLYTKVKTVRWC